MMNVLIISIWHLWKDIEQICQRQSVLYINSEKYAQQSELKIFVPLRKVSRIRISLFLNGVTMTKRRAVIWN